MPGEQLTPAHEVTEGLILSLLLLEEEQRLWSIDEVEREVGSHVATVDAIDRLHAVGLVHRIGEFVFATRAAVRHSQIGG